MKDFLINSIFWVFIAFCAFVGGCALCSPLKGAGDEDEYNDIKD